MGKVKLINDTINSAKVFIYKDPESDRYMKKGILHIFLADYNGKESIKLGKDLLCYEWVKPEEVMIKIQNSYSVFKKTFPIILNSLNLHFPLFLLIYIYFFSFLRISSSS